MPGAGPGVGTLSPELLRLLAEIGMLAAGRGMDTQAEAIFGALRELRPGQSAGYVGQAVARLNAGRADEAVELLQRDALAACPGDPEVRVFLGLALRLAQRPAEATRVLQGVAGDEVPRTVSALARRLLSAP